MILKLSLLISLLYSISCQELSYGIDQEPAYLNVIKGKRVALVVNHTSLDKNGEHLFNIVQKEAKLEAIFAPEHGFLGNHANGERVKDDLKNKIYSLHGKYKKPQKSQLENVDYLIYDIQDVGTRFYTYISTLGLVMQASAENNIPLLVLDRPVLIGGNRVEGTVLDSAYTSFIGKYPIPSTYGLTIGEIAQMIKGEKWLTNLQNLELYVIPLANWQREAAKFSDKRFIVPSPNIPSIESIYFYSALCFLEGTNVSEGRGTDEPFSTFGAAWLNQDAFLGYFNANFNFPVEFTKTEFVPITIKGKAYKPKFENENCFGFKLKLTNKDKFNGFGFGLAVLHSLAKTQDAFLVDRQGHFNWLFGVNVTKELLIDKEQVEQFSSAAVKDAAAFRELSKKYLLY